MAIAAKTRRRRSVVDRIVLERGRSVVRRRQDRLVAGLLDGGDDVLARSSARRGASATDARSVA